MTLQTIPGLIYWPGTTLGITAVYAFASGSTIDASGEYDAFIFDATENMVVDRVGFRPNAATGSPTAEIRIETVSAGLPTGTLFNASGGGSTGTTGTLSTSSMNVTTLAAAATINKGQRFAVVIKYATGTSFTVSNMSRGGLNEGTVHYPYRVTNTGTPTAAAFTSANVILGSSATEFYRLTGFFPIISTTSHTTANNATIRACCLRFQVPFKCRVIGARVLVSNSGTAEDFSMGIYSDAGAEVSSSLTAYDATDYVNLSGGPLEVYFDNAVTADVNTWYRCVYQPDTTSSSNFNYGTLENANHAKAMPRGRYTQTGTRDSGGTWTDFDTQVPMLDLIIDQLDDGAGGGGGGTYFSVGG